MNKRKIDLDNVIPANTNQLNNYLVNPNKIKSNFDRAVALVSNIFSSPRSKKKISQQDLEILKQEGKGDISRTR